MIQTRLEGSRGCGYRKPGGLYLVGPPTGYLCCKLPFALTVCPCCHSGFKPARGWTWIDADLLFAQQECQLTGNILPRIPCPLDSGIGMAGLLWVGEKYYPALTDFQQEAITMGISRRIGQVPRDFILGETWVLLAHRKAIPAIDPAAPDPHELIDTGHTIEAWLPGVFMVFQPTAIEYVVKGDETQEELNRRHQRGQTLVKVINRLPYVQRP